MSEPQENISNPETAPEQEGPQEEVATEPELTPEEEDGVIRSKVASGIGSRGGGNRVAQAMAKANKWFGLAEDEKEVARLEGTPLPPAETKPPKTPTRTVVLGRGAWPAIVTLVVCIPLIVWLIFTALDLSRQLDAVKSLNAQLQSQGGQSDTLVSILNSPSIQTYRLAPTEPLPDIQANLHVAGPRLLALTTRQLNSLVGKDRVFVLYLVRKVETPGPNDYYPLVAFNGGTNTVSVVDPALIPADIGPDKYSQFIITDEPINKQVQGKPEGPVHFTLDVSKITFK